MSQEQDAATHSRGPRSSGFGALVAMRRRSTGDERIDTRRGDQPYERVVTPGPEQSRDGHDTGTAGAAQDGGRPGRLTQG